MKDVEPGWPPDPLPGLIGGKVQHRQTVVSTSDVARSLLARKAADGTVILAEEQTGGRGRLGRRWVAPPGSSILASFILRPQGLPTRSAFLLTAAMGAALWQSVQQTCAPCDALYLKWPNDLYLSGGKVAGILTEVDFSGETVGWAIIGVGINVNFDPATVAQLPATATSLSAAVGHPLSRAILFRHLCTGFEQRYRQLQAGDHATVLAEWSSRLGWRGQAVTVSDGGQPVLRGIFEGVDADGALILGLADGSSQRVVAGDLSLRLSGEVAP